VTGFAVSDSPGQHFPVSDRQRIAAYGVMVDDDGRLLLARASPFLDQGERWFLPGGGVQHGEQPADSVRREIEEETGLTVVLGPLLDVLSDVRTLPDGFSLHTVRIIYRVESWQGSLRAEVNGTTDAVQWVSPEELSTRPLARYVHDVVDRLL
jgi:ADP-ribose pyrophosphatase YjhB (NUDIX family)